jgi:hypothetical protein
MGEMQLSLYLSGDGVFFWWPKKRGNWETAGEEKVTHLPQYDSCMGMRGRIRQLLEMPACACDGFAGLIRTLLEFGNVFIKFSEQTNLAVWLHRNLFFSLKKSPPPEKKDCIAQRIFREKKNIV